MSDSKVPAIGTAVLVSFFSGSQQLSTVVAHVLGITGAAADLATADGLPALTVAYPDPAADPAILSSPNGQKAYVRKTGVVHFSHPSALEGQASIVWGYPVRAEELPSLIKRDAPAVNPVFERPVDVQVPEVQLGLHDAVTLRSESEPVAVAAVPVPAQDTAVDAADQSAHNAAVAADQAAKTADDAAANAAEVHSS